MNYLESLQDFRSDKKQIQFYMISACMQNMIMG